MARRKRNLWVSLLVVVVAIAVWWFEQRQQTTKENVALEALIEDGRSDRWVEGEAVVLKTLPDDRDGSKHQRWLVRAGRGNTILFAHNIDLAPRVPLDEGDTITFRGEYEWNEKGGVIHWTHHDPRGRKEGGWIELRGKRYE